MVTRERMEFFRIEWAAVTKRARELLSNMERDGLVGTITIAPQIVIEQSRATEAMLEERAAHLEGMPPWASSSH